MLPPGEYDKKNFAENSFAYRAIASFSAALVADVFETLRTEEHSRSIFEIEATIFFGAFTLALVPLAILWCGNR